MTGDRDRDGGGTPAIDYDGRWFGLVADPLAPVDPHDRPFGQYHQDGSLVWAEFYAGGRLRSGRLVGLGRPDGTIDAGYCLLTVDGEVVTGRVHSVPEVLPDGRIRLADHYRRLDGSTGVSYIEELPRPPERAGGLRPPARSGGGSAHADNRGQTRRQ